jgi:hypothetical protein
MWSSWRRRSPEVAVWPLGTHETLRRAGRTRVRLKQMRTWPKRWRWWLPLGGLCLTLLGALGALLQASLAPDTVRLTFGRIQMGMTTSEVDALTKHIKRVKTGRRVSSAIVAEEYFPPSMGPLKTAMRPGHTARVYALESGDVIVVFRNDRAIYKYSARYENPTVWDTMGGFLKRVRAAVGL